MLFALFINGLFSDLHCSISRKIELNSISEIELLSIAFENNPLTDRCFVSAIEIVFFFSCFVIFLLRVLLPTLNAVDINPKKPAKTAIGAPTINPNSTQRNRHTAC